MTSNGSAVDRDHHPDSGEGSPTTRSGQVIPVAVVGMACRLPGGIGSPEQLWQALLQAHDPVTEIPADRWDAEAFYDPDPDAPGRSAGRWGAFLDDIAGFDAEFFGIDPDTATAIDPQHRLLLETAWEVVEHAGLTPTLPAQAGAGVFIGLTRDDFARRHPGPDRLLQNGAGAAAGRIAAALGLRGPALTLDTADSSGLTAVHLACRSLTDGECDLALAGAAFVMLDPDAFVAASARHLLSPTGRSRAFDAAADGLVWGEACAVVALKRLDDALAAGDRVLAVIRASAARHHGRADVLAAPPVPAQTALFRTALAAAGVRAEDIGMIEAYGLGHPAADAAEFRALSEVYGTAHPCALGSITTNFGNAAAAGGVLGLMKAVLAVRHGVIPPHLHFSRLPDELARIRTGLFVPQTATDWPAGPTGPRRAAVSSYGAAGTDVHVVVEQPPNTPATPAAADGALLVPVSASSTEALRDTASRLADWLERHESVAAGDLAYTLARRRGHRPVRTCLAATDRAGLIAALRALSDGTTAAEPPATADAGGRGPVWLFADHALDWTAAAELLDTDPVFAARIAELEPVVAAEAGFSVTAALREPGVLTGPDRIQPAAFAVQVALAAALQAAGVRPGAVIGYSTGETTAAVVAGALTPADGARVVCARARLLARLDGAGAMVAVPLAAKQVLSELTMRGIKDAAVAVAAAPQTTVVSGATASLGELAAAWRERGLTTTELAGPPVHSPAVDAVTAEFTELLAGIAPQPPTLPFYSTTGFDPRERPACDARYWLQNLRRTTRFSAAVRAALDDGYRVFVEPGPRPLLSDWVAQTAAGVDVAPVTTTVLGRGRLPDAVSELYCLGATIDFAALYPTGRIVDAPLPAWTHRRLWPDTAAAAPSAGGEPTITVHPLLGPRVALPELPERHVWQAEVGTAARPWLADHRVNDVPVLPGAVLCELALAAAHTLLGDAAEVRDLAVANPVRPAERTALAAAASASAAGAFEFTVDSRQGRRLLRHAGATLHPVAGQRPPGHDLTALLDRHPRVVDGAEIRARLADNGFGLGEAFAALVAAHVPEQAGDTVLAELALPAALRREQAGYRVHPALLDACFQALAANPQVRGLAETELGALVAVKRLCAWDSARNARWCHGRISAVDDTGVEADLDVLDADGAVLVRLQGVRFDIAAGEQRRTDRRLAQSLLAVEWRRGRPPEPDGTAAGTWVLVDAEPAAAGPTAALAAALDGLGARAVTLNWPPQDESDGPAGRLAEQLQAGETSGLVVVFGPGTDAHPTAGLDRVRHLARIVDALVGCQARLPRLYLVTHGAQAVLPGEAPAPAYAALRGLTRVLGAEDPHLQPTQIDLDDRTHPGLPARQLLSGSPEDETAWRDGTFYTARLRPAPLRPDERRHGTADHDRDGLRVQVRTPGDLDTLELTACDRIPPGPGQIEVAVQATGVNFADVQLVTGQLTDDELFEPGTDFVGRVVAVGPGVAEPAVGDRVVGLCPGGGWGTFVTCDARLAVRVPASLADGRAAALATAGTVAWYALHEQARLRRGERVLIHSAAGAVGQVAVDLARRAGAEVFATAGTEERRQALRDLGVGHVYDAGDPGFVRSIRHDTAGHGVDVVIGALPGGLRRAALELLAPGGRLVDLGRPGDAAPLDPNALRHNRTVCHVDLVSLSRTHPGRVGAALRTVLRLAADGELTGPCHTTRPLAEAADAVRSTHTDDHRGRIVLEVGRPGRSAVVLPPQQVPVFRSDGAYLVTGGLDEAGLFLAEKLAAAGCGRILLAAPQQPTLKQLQTVEMIRAMGSDVIVQCCDPADPTTAARLVAAATATGLPLRGVLLNQATDLGSFEQQWAATVLAAWRLHEAVAGQPLDWFCTGSSTTALTGAPGRSAAAAAADAWLDGFARWRHAQGLPTTTIAWNPVPAEDRMTALAALLRHDRPHTGWLPDLDRTWLVVLAQRSPFAEAFRADAGHGGGGRLRAELDSLAPDERPARVRRLIADQISMVLRRSIDPDRPLAEYGIDSLGAVELRTRLEHETGIRLAAGDIAAGTVRELADLLCARLVPTESE